MNNMKEKCNWEEILLSIRRQIDSIYNDIFKDKHNDIIKEAVKEWLDEKLKLYIYERHSKINIVKGHYVVHCNIKNLQGFYAESGTILDVCDNVGNYSYYICENGLWTEISKETKIIFI